MASNIFNTILKQEDGSPPTPRDLTSIGALVGKNKVLQFPPGLGGESVQVYGKNVRPSHTIPFTIFAPYKRARLSTDVLTSVKTAVVTGYDNAKAEYDKSSIPGLSIVGDIKSGVDAAVGILAKGFSTGSYSMGGEKLFDSLPTPSFAIALPTPTTALKTNYAMTYDTVNIGAIGAIVQGVDEQTVRNAVTGAAIGATVGSLFNAGKAGALLGLGAGAGGQTGLVQGGFGLLQSGLEALGSTGSVVNILAGAAENPYTENVFKNVNFREHNFSYVFMPKNEAESEQIDQIIQMFKYAMHPKTTTILGAQGFFEFPYEFQITHSVQDTTFTLLPSVLSSLEVDYSGGTDSPKFFVPIAGTGKQYPARITLSMTFKEMVLLTRERMDLPKPQLVSDDTADPPSWRYRF